MKYEIKKINFYGCPNAGKSVAAALCYAQLACAGRSVELVREVHKEFIAKRAEIPKKFIHALYVEQMRREKRALKIADMLVSDCPLPLCAFYAQERGVRLEIDLPKERKQLNILIDPDFDKPFDARGRIHAKEDQRRIQSALIDFLVLRGIDFHPLRARDIPMTGKFVEHLLGVNGANV